MSCPLCDDTGWRPIEVDGVRRVERCECWRATLADRLLADANIPPRYRRCDLENFREYNDSLNHAVRAAKRFVEGFPGAVDRGLFLIGHPGVGKTHLGVAVLKHCIRDKGARGIFYDTRELLRVIRSTYNPLVHTAEMDVLRPVMEADLLVLDDLGAEKTSEWVEETLNLIVNTRYNERRVTIFTSNYEIKDDLTDPDSLAVRVGFRMWSRLHEMCDFLKLDGVDYRELGPDASLEELVRLEKRGRPSIKKTLPARAGGPVRAQLREKSTEDRHDLRWTGGKAGS
jgi:DNA replication protein DnaC